MKRQLPTAHREKMRLSPRRAGSVLALFGQETRYVASLYLQRAFIFTAVTLAIVLSLDIASNIGSVMSAQDHASGLDGPARLAFYVSLRVGYVLPSILPIAGIIGVVWAEYGLVVSHERIMISNSGRPYLRSLIPAALAGLVIGLLQFGALAYIRPLAVEAQATNSFRYYGPKFSQPRTTKPKWIAIDHAAINARIEIDSVPKLRDILVYLLDDDGKLDSIVSSTFAESGPFVDIWTFHNGSQWSFETSSSRKVSGQVLERTSFDTLQIPLKLDPLWVYNFGIKPQLQPQKLLATLAFSELGIPDIARYRSVYHERFASILYSVGMALVGASLSLLTFTTKMHPFRALKVGLYGAGTHIGSSMLAMLGSYGNLSPFVAAWALPLIIVCAAVYVVYRHHQKVQEEMTQSLNFSLA